MYFTDLLICFTFILCPGQDGKINHGKSDIIHEHMQAWGG